MQPVFYKENPIGIQVVPKPQPQGFPTGPGWSYATNLNRSTDIDIGDFLSRGARNPEHQALLRLIGTLVQDSGEAAAP